MKKIKIVLITALLFGLIFLAACGDDAGDEENNGVDDVPEQDTEIEDPEIEDESENDAENGTDEAESDTSETDGTESQTDETENSDQNENGDNQSDEAADEQEVVMENEAFRIFEPAENAVVGNEFTVRGEASVHEANVQYEFEDGHNILDEGHVTAETAAPEWGAFEITISFDEVWQNSGTVIIFEEDVASGERKNQIYIPVTVED